MRCPHCGYNNADDALFCAQCGVRQPQTGDATEAEVDALMDNLPTVKAQRKNRINEVLAQETRMLRNGEAAKPKEDCAHREADVQTDASVLEPGGTVLMNQPLAEQADNPEPAVDADPYAQDSEILHRPDANDMTVPDVAATTLRPVPAPEKQEEYFVVRNTRDYDHDAQSVNQVSDVSNFETLHRNKPARDGWFDPYARSARKGDVLGEGNSRSKLRPLLALFVIALVLGAAGGVLTYGMELWGGRRVPYLLGESQATAEALLEEKGLVANVEAQPADDAIGKVIDQDPELGARIPEGSEVKVVVATNRTMPEVVGLSEDEARALLKEAGAEQIETKTKQTSEAEGTVLEVKPAAGEPFISRSTVTLTVATPFRVPDVIGKKESDAVSTLEEQGYSTEVTYVNSSETVRTVISTDPGAGEVISEGGTVRVVVSSPYPADPLHLAEFFNHSSQDVDTYLQEKGYNFDKGYIDSYGNALATYTSSDKGNFTFSSQPYVRTTVSPKEGSSNVMATGVPIAGVRLDFAASQIPEGYDKEAVEKLVEACGFTGQMGTCDNKSVRIPAGSPKTNASFICASGEMDDLVWTVIIVGNSSTKRASATCAKKGLYSASELEGFDGKVRNYVAYQEAYLSSAFQVVEVKKEETKSSENSNGQTGNTTNQEGGNGGQNSSQQQGQ